MVHLGGRIPKLPDVVSKQNVKFRTKEEFGNTIDSGNDLSRTIDNLRVFVNKTLSILSTLSHYVDIKGVDSTLLSEIHYSQ